MNIALVPPFPVGKSHLTSPPPLSPSHRSHYARVQLDTGEHAMDDFTGMIPVQSKEEGAGFRGSLLAG